VLYVRQFDFPSPTQPPRTVAVTAFVLVFSLVFSPRYLYYRGQKNNNNNRAPGRSAMHHALNDLVARSFASAGTPVTKEPTGLFRTDGKRPDRLTLVPWRHGHMPSGRFIRHWVRPRGRCCSGTGQSFGAGAALQRKKSTFYEAAIDTTKAPIV